jgi:putative aldouronate transport system permease protein
MSRIIPAGRRRPAAAPQPQRRISFSLRMKRVLRAWQLYVLLAPAIIYILVFKYWPMYGVQIAFKNYNPVDGFTDSPWVGLTHFIRFVNSYQFGQVIGNTLWIALLGLLVAFPVPIILALLVT